MPRQVTVGQVEDKIAELNRFCKAVMDKPKPAPPPPPPKADAAPGQFVARFGMHACLLRPGVWVGDNTAVKGPRGKDKLAIVVTALWQSGMLSWSVC